MAKTMRRLGAAFLLIAALVLLGATVPRPLWPIEARGAGERRILVLTNPIHTDIAIPVDAVVRARFAFLEEAGMPVGDPGARWLVFGWGGRAFYLETPTWADLKPLPVLKALTLDRAVMHVELAGDIPEPHPAVAGYELDTAGFDRLVEFIAASFETEGGAPRIVPGASYGAYDRFYEAHGRFNLIVGCNTWTARALRQAGLTTGWWNPLPQSLAVSLDMFN